MFEDASPFTYDEEIDSVVHKSSLDHLDSCMLMPVFSEKYDGNRIARVTTWTTE